MLQYKDQYVKGNIYVIDVNVDAILGREWLQNIKVYFAEMKQIKDPGTTHNLQGILQKYSSLFEEGLGKIQNFKGILILKEDVAPVFRPHRKVPYALRNKVLDEIDRLKKLGN